MVLTKISILVIKLSSDKKFFKIKIPTNPKIGITIKVVNTNFKVNFCFIKKYLVCFLINLTQLIIIAATIDKIIADLDNVKNINIEKANIKLTFLNITI